MRLVSKNPVFIEFCELKNESLTFRDLSTFDIVAESVLWQKLDILKIYMSALLFRAAQLFSAINYSTTVDFKAK